jgi:hypothetical protein
MIRSTTAPVALAAEATAALQPFQEERPPPLDEALQAVVGLAHVRRERLGAV